jgi:hypothetical protein
VTLAAMRALVFERLDEDPSNPGSWTAAEVNAALNDAQSFFALITLVLEKTLTLDVTTTLGAPFAWMVGTPDWLMPLRVRCAGQKVRPMRLADMEALDQGWLSAPGTAFTRYGQIGADHLFFYPSAHAQLDIRYAYSPAVMAADNDTPQIPDVYHPLLPLYAKYQLLQKLGGAEFQKGMADLKEFLAAAGKCADLVRARCLAYRYDNTPVEISRLDLSSLVTVRKDLLPKKAAPDGG